MSFNYGKGIKLRGYRLIWDWGTNEHHVDFSDVVLANLKYEITEGGSVTVAGTIQDNGEELQDNDLFGELSGLAAEGEITISLIAPAEIVLAKKGYRAGKSDTPAVSGSGDDDSQQELDDSDPDEMTPEKAFADAVDDSPI